MGGRTTPPTPNNRHPPSAPVLIPALHTQTHTLAYRKESPNVRTTNLMDEQPSNEALTGWDRTLGRLDGGMGESRVSQKGVGTLSLIESTFDCSPRREAPNFFVQCMAKVNNLRDGTTGPACRWLCGCGCVCVYVDTHPLPVVVRRVAVSVCWFIFHTYQEHIY